MRHSLPIILILLLLGCANSYAQFKDEAFSQNYSSTESEKVDSSNLFTFKNYFRGLAHREEVKPGTLVLGSMVFVGGDQIYNHQVWKLPIIYGGIGAGVGLGLKYRDNGDIRSSNLAFAAAGAVYWTTMLDGIINYDRGREHDQGKAALYSMILPGLGQIYNNEEWKVPIYWGCLLGAVHFYSKNKMQFERFQRIFHEANDPDVEYTGPISSQTAEYYKGIYREYRDYSLAAIAGFYLLQIIDAHVFSLMRDFEINDDVSLDVRPAIIAPDQNSYCFNHPGTGYGFSLGLNF